MVHLVLKVSVNDIGFYRSLLPGLTFTQQKPGEVTTVINFFSEAERSSYKEALREKLNYPLIREVEPVREYWLNGMPSLSIVEAVS